MTKPRYTTEEQIVKRIDRYLIKHKLAMANRQALVNDMDSVIRANPNVITAHWVSVRKDGISKANRQIDYIERKLNRLKEKLAEFKTPVLFGDDHSVAA